MLCYLKKIAKYARSKQTKSEPSILGSMPKIDQRSAIHDQKCMRSYVVSQNSAKKSHKLLIKPYLE